MTWYTDARQESGEPALLDAEGIASYLGTNRTGPDTTISGVDALDAAGEADLAFCTYDDPDAVGASDAGVVICAPDVDPLPGRALVHADRPKAAFVRIVDEFFRQESTETVVHPTAVVEPGATVGEGCRIGAQAYVGDCVTLGDRCTVGHGAVLGGEGFGFSRVEDDELTRQLHVGRVVLEDDVAVGPNSSIDRAVFDETVVGRGTKLSGNVHLAHQVRLGEDVTVAFGAGFAGGATVGDRTTVHPNVSVATDIAVGPDAELGMNAAVLDDVGEGTTVVGSPARPVEEGA